jgi:hypothetical protein
MFIYELSAASFFLLTKKKRDNLEKNFLKLFYVLTMSYFS